MTPAQTTQRVRPSSNARTMNQSAATQAEHQQRVRVVVPRDRDADRRRRQHEPGREPGQPPERTPDEVVHERDGRDAHQRLRHEDRQRGEAEDPRRQRLDPERERRLVDGHDAARSRTTRRGSCASSCSSSGRRRRSTRSPSRSDRAPTGSGARRSRRARSARGGRSGRARPSGRVARGAASGARRGRYRPSTWGQISALRLMTMRADPGRTLRADAMVMMQPVRRTAVIDMGSNSFRLVVYGWEPGRSWQHVDEIREAVRVSTGMAAKGAIKRGRFKYAVNTAVVFSSFCQAAGIDEVIPVATSAIRDATNQAELLEAFKEHAGLDVRVLSGEDETRYGYLAIANSIAIDDGFGLDMGGGSVQLMEIDERRLGQSASWPLGAVRVSEEFLRRREDDAQADEGAAQARRQDARRARLDPERRARQVRGDRRHDPQPRLGGAEARGRPRHRRRPGLRAHARRARGAGRRADRAAGRRARRRPRDQARPRRRDPRRGDGARRADGGDGLRPDRGQRPGPARGRLLRALPRGARPAARRERAARVGDEPRAALPGRDGPPEARRASCRCRSSPA